MYRTFVPASGPIEAKIAIVGEQPGYQEVRARPPRPFIGPAGQGLDECLAMTKIYRRGLYITNVVKDLDAPLAHYINLDTRGKWTISADGYNYINELGVELRKLNLNIVIAMGNIALLALTNRVGITKWRGSILESTLIPGLKVIGTFHPATFIPPKFNFLNKPLICEDLLKAKYESGFKEIKRLARKVHTHIGFGQTISILRNVYRVGRLGQIIGIDIEVINKEIDCIGISWSPTESICIPFRFSGGDYFTVEQELAIMRDIAYIIQDENIQKAGASFIFDTQFLFHKYGIIPCGSLHCTQIAQKISYPDFPAGLDAVTTTYTDIPYYKQDGKQWMKMGLGTWEQWWNYNGIDAMVPVDSIPKQIEVLKKQYNEATYERQRKLIKPLLYMGERGIRIDVSGMMEYEKDQTAILNEKSAELKSIVGRDINPNSPKQLMDYFYKELGNKAYKKKNATGQYNDSIDIDALKRLVRQGGSASEAARVMLDIRSLSKRISTYLNIGKVDKDGRYRSSYKPAGAKTGRLSSGETIFGLGGNQQNYPHDLLRFFLFDKGYIGYSFDLSQIENRIVAYTGGVLAQIEAFEQGIDLHTLTASIIFRKPYNQISKEDGSSTLGDGRQSERYWGKKCKFRHCEVLTQTGWVGIGKAYETKCKIAQWSKEGNISFEDPSSWFVDKYSGDSIVIENQRIYQESTPDHKMPLYYDGRFIDKSVKEYPKSGKYRAPLSGTFNEGTLHLPDSIVMLMVAFQADGSWQGNEIRFHLSKDRKIKRIRAILDLSDIIYSENNGTFLISTKNKVCGLISLLMGREKLFGSWLFELTQESLLTFIEELHHWDGYTDGQSNEYFTTNLNNAVWVQTIAHLVDKAANIGHQDNSKNSSFGNKMLYRVSIRNSTMPATSAIDRHTKVVIDESIYCPTMPSGYFMCRERGIISVTGNSNHGINYDESYKKFALVNEITETEAKQILEEVHRGYPQIRNGYHTMIQDMLKSSRTVTNLFGRTRLFLGPVYESYPNTPRYACTETFRQAYAHFAQSTCADKVNEQGIEYIYYNQNLFKPIELLAQIHDSIVFQIPLTIKWTEQAKMLLLIKQSLETPLIWHEREIPTPVDLAIGLNMNKEIMEELKSKDIPNNIEKLAENLQLIYNKLKR